MKKIELSNGFKCEVDERIGNDFDLLMLIRESTKDGGKYLDVVEYVFGKEQVAKLLDSIRSVNNGFLPTQNLDGKTFSVTDAVLEAMEAVGVDTKNL